MTIPRTQGDSNELSILGTVTVISHIPKSEMWNMRRTSLNRIQVSAPAKLADALQHLDHRWK